MASEPGENPLGPSDPSRSGPDIDAAVQNAESGSRAEGVHRPAEEGQEPGESRLEQLREVPQESGGSGHADADADAAAEPPEPGPQPDEVGSGGAQRIVGARISDRVAGGEPRPDGPPFRTDRDE